MVLNGNPSATVMVTCSTSNASALPNSTTASDFTLTFTSANGTQPQPIKLGTVGDISSDQSVSISCVPSNAGGLTSADQATFVVAAVKLKILVVAGASAVSPSGTGLTPTNTSRVPRLASPDPIRDLAAASSGVSPAPARSRCVAHGVAPRSSRSRTRAGEHWAAATWRAVMPPWAAAQGSAPASARASTTSTAPTAAAMNSGVTPRDATCCGDAPRARSHRTSSVWPRPAAQDSGWPSSGVAVARDAPRATRRSISCTEPMYAAR